MKEEVVNAYAKKVYDQNCAVGWWDDPDRCPLQTLQLVNTEISEATEGDRKNKMDDKLPERKMAEVELADTFIRLVDLAGRYGWKYGAGIGLPPMYHSCHNLAAKHLVLTSVVCNLAQIGWAMGMKYDASENPQIVLQYSLAMKVLLHIAKEHGYDLQGAIDEKIAFNATRADHKRENRAAEGGKAY